MANRIYRPHSLEWPPTPEQWQSLNEIIDDLYALLRAQAALISAGSGSGGSGSGLPSGAADGDYLQWLSGAATWDPHATSGVTPGTYGTGGTGSGGSGGSSIDSDTLANRPAAGTDGAAFLPTDGVQLYRDDGSVWQPWGPIFPFAEPDDADFGWINQGTASVSTTAGGIYLQSPADGSGANLRIRKMTAPATPWTLTVYLLPAIFRKAFHSYGICFRESSTGKLHVFDVLSTNSTTNIRSSKFTGPTVFSTDYQLTACAELYRWFRIQDTGTNRICSYSPDGQHWIQFHSITRTDFLTGGADEIGFFVAGENSTTPNLAAALTLLHWRLE